MQLRSQLTGNRRYQVQVTFLDRLQEAIFCGQPSTGKGNKLALNLFKRNLRSFRDSLLVRGGISAYFMGKQG